MKGCRTGKPDYSILAAFDQPITRSKTGVGYRVCLLVVTLTMLILPVIYVAFVGALVWAVHYHAVYDWGPIMHLGGFVGGGRIFILKFLLYAVPLVAGVIVVFFMFKPLLAGRPKRAQPFELNPAENPLLYAFIAKISDVVGAPTPARIDMDCELNASASFRRGFRSMAGNDLVLTIGMPLAANCSAQELAGVIAHEFGHFTQGAGMRLSYIIRSINFWFVRVAYQRDAWDEALEQWAAEVDDLRAAVFVWSVQVAVWLSRLVLKILLFTGHLVAGFMLRQMEYDADSYQIRVAGSETFEATHRKLATLDAALGATYNQIRTRWNRSRQLPDNLSELLRQTHENLPPAVLQKIDDQLGFRRTGLFDSHPSPADRIRRARQAAEAGIFHDARPASCLFANFEEPARAVTLLHYTQVIGIPVSEKMLLHVESTQSNAARGYAANPTDAADDFFLGMLPVLMPLRLGPVAPSTHREADWAELNQLTAGLQQVAGQIMPLVAQYTESLQKSLDGRVAARLLEMGVPIEPKTFGLASATVEAAKALAAEGTAAHEALSQSLREVTAALKRRLELALAIRLLDEREAGATESSQNRFTDLAARVNRSAEEYASREQAREAFAVWNHINAIRQSTGETPAVARALEAQNQLVNSLIPQTGGQPIEVARASGQPLRLARSPSHAGPMEAESLRQGTQQWFAEYRKTVIELAEFAQFAEAAGR